MSERKVPSMKIVGPVTTLVFALLGFGLAALFRHQNLLGQFGLVLPSVGIALLGALVSFAMAAGLYLVWPALRSSTDLVARQSVQHILATEGWAGIVLGVLLTPIGEEILFRGGVQPSAGLILASVLFGLAHGGWRRDTLSYAVTAGLIGVVLGLVYVATGSLAASSLAHVTYNLAVTVLLAKNAWPFVREETVHHDC